MVIQFCAMIKVCDHFEESDSEEEDEKPGNQNEVELQKKDD